MTSPLDVRLLRAANEAVQLFKEAAGTPYTWGNANVTQDPAGDFTVMTIEFRVQHVGAVDGNETLVSPFMEYVKRGEANNPESVEEVPNARLEPILAQDEPEAKDALPYYENEPQLEADQTPCGRCHWPKWKHYVDGSGGFATCSNFTEAKQLTLVK